MIYGACEQFQGVWLGSIASVLAQRIDDWEQTQKWLAARSRVAKAIIQASKSEVESLKRDRYGDTNNQEVEVEETNLFKSNTAALVLLPLIIFSEGDRHCLTEAIANQPEQSLITAANQEEILLWSYLLSLALNCKFEPQALNIRQAVKQALIGLRLKETALVEKLEKLVICWEKGFSLHQLAEKLLEGGNLTQTAIVLSYYCFATTPQDFKISVKRADNLDPKVAYLTVILTATLSGAYNGVAGIPRSWRAIANQNHTYQKEQQTAAKLLKTWLGIYSLENNQLKYDRELHAVALANTIQPRLNLKIISQKSYLS